MECRDCSGLPYITFCVPRERVLQKMTKEDLLLASLCLGILFELEKFFPSENSTGREMYLDRFGKNVVQCYLCMCVFSNHPQRGKIAHQVS